VVFFWVVVWVSFFRVVVDIKIFVDKFDAIYPLRGREPVVIPIPIPIPLVLDDDDCLLL
jgi:hypothetical protein